MDSLVKLLQDYKASKDISPFLESGVSLDPQTIQSHILALPEDEQQDIRQILSSLQKDLENYIAQAMQDLDEVKGQIDQNLKTSQACVSYTNAQDLGQKKKD